MGVEKLTNIRGEKKNMVVNSYILYFIIIMCCSALRGILPPH